MSTMTILGFKYYMGLFQGVCFFDKMKMNVNIGQVGYSFVNVSEKLLNIESELFSSLK